jgi:uncharacterized membrane protein
LAPSTLARAAPIVAELGREALESFDFFEKRLLNRPSGTTRGSRRRRFEAETMDARSGQAHGSVLLSSDRLASLSDTMFGVAMTVLATTLLPSIQANKGSVLDMLAAMNGELVAVVLSFAISARYWVSQQQRLAMTKSVTSRETWLHLTFLFLIVLVPISTSLPGLVGPRVVRDSVLLYAIHLSTIALVNLLLWLEVHRVAVAHIHVVRSVMSLALVLIAVAVGAFWPQGAVYLWLAVLAAPMAGGYVTRRLYGV